jgi:DNA-binding NarL/FixJ family response regulator
MRILIADDSEIVRRGIRGLLSGETTWEVCGEAVDGADTLRKARELLPDLIVLDISMPGVNGLKAAGILRHEVPKAKILVMSQHDPVLLLPRALEAGAHACMDKGRLSADLLRIIESIEGTTQGHRLENAD